MTKSPVHSAPVPAPWVNHLNAEELQRLTVLETRLERKTATIGELLSERRKMMRRAIRRMRRTDGKE